MKNLAPSITRQRLLIEGFYTVEMSQETLEKYLLDLAENLNLRIYGEPIIFTTASGMGKEENAGYDAFVPLIDSGISAYVWSHAQFFSIVIYTCKSFSESAAVAFTERYFVVPEAKLVSMSF